jgi:hypothetical protein
MIPLEIIGRQDVEPTVRGLEQLGLLLEPAPDHAAVAGRKAYRVYGEFLEILQGLRALACDPMYDSARRGLVVDLERWETRCVPSLPN